MQWSLLNDIPAAELVWQSCLCRCRVSQQWVGLSPSVWMQGTCRQLPVTASGSSLWVLLTGSGPCSSLPEGKPPPHTSAPHTPAHTNQTTSVHLNTGSYQCHYEIHCIRYIGFKFQFWCLCNPWPLVTLLCKNVANEWAIHILDLEKASTAGNFSRPWVQV